MAEQLANFGETTLNEALDDTETTVTVTDGAVFPSSGNFRVVVDDELMVVTARSTNDLTVTRGAESTSAAAHANGADIRMVLTAASLPAHVQQTLGSLAVDLSVAGAATADFSTAATHDWTLTGAATATLTGAMTDYATDYRLIVRQDATGGRDFDLDTNNSITWVGMGTASPTFGTAASSVDVIGLVSTDDGTSYLGFHTNPDLTNPMTTSGDIIYGGASGVPTRLGAGTNGDVLTLASGLPSWAAGSGLSTGTSFPGSPSTGDRYRRSDLDYLIFFYDGTRWLSEEIFTRPIELHAVTSASVGGRYAWPNDGLDVYMIDHVGSAFVATTTGGSDYWGFHVYKTPPSGAGSTDLGNENTSTWSADTFTKVDTTINAVIDVSATPTGFVYATIDAGSPGALQLRSLVRWRYIAT